MRTARRLAAACWALAVLLSGCASEPPRPTRAATYTVKAGDTLYAIAWRLRLDYRELARWNGINDKFLIRPGQVLRLQPGTGQVAAAAPPRVRPVTPMPKSASTRPTALPRAATPVPRTMPRTVPSMPAVPGPPTAPIAAVRWQWPIEGGVAELTTRPNGGQGLNIMGEVGQPVLAAAEGKVVYTGTGLLGYGQLLIIKHNENYLTAYGHIQSITVGEGDSVSAGQRVAAMGSGPAGSPLLYFEIRLNGTPGNPLLLLPQRS
jgi:lipoprotein NlpD